MKVWTGERGTSVATDKREPSPVPLFQRFMLRFNTCAAVLSWPAFGWLALTRDWTVIVVPLIMTTGVVMQSLLSRKIYGTSRPLRQVPDYSAIARMERDVWGQALEHAGAPAPATQPRRVSRAQIDTMLRAGMTSRAIEAELGLTQHAGREPLSCYLKHVETEGNER